MLEFVVILSAFHSEVRLSPFENMVMILARCDLINAFLKSSGLGGAKLISSISVSVVQNPYLRFRHQEWMAPFCHIRYGMVYTRLRWSRLVGSVFLLAQIQSVPS